MDAKTEKEKKFFAIIIEFTMLMTFFYVVKATEYCHDGLSLVMVPHTHTHTHAQNKRIFFFVCQDRYILMLHSHHNHTRS